MPAGNASVLINGVMYSWANASIPLFGAPIVGITKIEINQEQEKENLYGVGNKPIGRGYGNKKYDGSLSVYSEEFFRWVNAVSSGDIMDIPYFDFPMVLVSAKGTPQIVKVQAAEFLKSPFHVAQGETKIILDLPLVIGNIQWK